MVEQRADMDCHSNYGRQLRLFLLLSVIFWPCGKTLGQLGTEPSEPAALGQPSSQEASSFAQPLLPGPEQTEQAAAEAALRAEQEMVVDVRIAGNKSVPLEKILPHIRTRPGRPFDLELIEEDVRRLDQTRLFVNIKTYWQQVPGGRVVIFDLLERPLLQDVKFIGCKEIRKKVLQKEADIKVGDAADPYTIEEARRKLEELYHKRGFTGATVTLLEGNKPEDRRAIFLINEGVKQRVLWVDFVGNTIATDARLRTQIKSKPPFLYLFKGELDRKQLDEDVERLTAYYRSLGFFRARIGRELSFNEQENWVTVTFVIDEGPRYRIRNVHLLGNSKFTTEELLAELKLKDGEYFNQAKMTTDLASLQDKYGSIGHVFAEVKADPRFLEEPGWLDLFYNIKEGDRYRVGKIDVQIKGEYPHTQLTTILNRLSIKPGDIVDIREIRASERRLRASGLFESNPATGSVPKIVFSPPNEELPEKADGDQPKTEERSGKGRKVRSGGPLTPFHSSTSTPPQTRDRNLVLTCDCGRYVGPQEASGDGPPKASSPPPAGEPSAASLTTERDEELWQAATELCKVLATSRQATPSRTRTILTQYSPNAGQTNPAAKLVGQTSSKSVEETKEPLRAPDAAQPAASSTESPTAMPPSPPYGQSTWPRSGRTRPVESPEGPYIPGPIFSEDSPFRDGSPEGGDLARTLPFTVTAEETMTGRLMFGVGINSDAGLVGQIVLDEQNFDWTRFPRSWEEIRNATAWRGAGQRFRLEAVPGTQLHRYMVSFQEPYLFNTAVSLGLSGYYYNRSYREWFEQRLGGRVALGYQFTPDLAGSVAYRGAKINITNPLDPTLPELAEVLGRDLALHGFQVSLTHDKRDNAFLATEGHLIEMSFEQVLGSYTYPHAEIDLRKYFTLHERPDGSGRHVLSLGCRAGYTGDDTPIYEHYFAGGFSTIRGFEFRGASPHVYSSYVGDDIFVGGHFLMLASLEYLFPITADDMLRGVIFCDTGTVEPTINDWSNRYRVAPGFGLRICVPAMGPAPIALDFAFPVSWEPGDRFEVFSFFIGFGR